MGYYIPNDKPITAYPGVEQIDEPKSLTDVGNNEAIICEVDNDFFVANGFAYSQSELEAFQEPDDPRPKRWFKMPLDQAKTLSGYTK